MGLSSIRQRYEGTEYFDYPEMERLLNEVIEHPEMEIVIPNDFINKSLEDSGFWLGLIRKIKILFQKVVTNIKYYLSYSYQGSFDRAVVKIENAYVKKVAVIGEVSAQVKQNLELINKDKKEFLPLKNRIKVLESEMDAHKKNIEEKINAKNEIVRLAKDLKIRKEHETPFEKLTHIFSVDPAIGKIKNLDSVFPIDNLTDITIEAYETENFEASPLIREIKKGNLEGSAKEELLQNERRTLEEMQDRLKSGIQNMQKNIQEVRLLKLEDFFTKDELTGLEFTEEGVVEVINTPTHLRAIHTDIANLASGDLATLFTTLLNRFPEDEIVDWHCDARGEFTLQCKKTLKIWMPEKDPVGGAVLMFGYGTNGMVKGKVEKNKISFHSGFNSSVIVTFFGCLTPTFDSLEYRTNFDVRIRGTAKGITTERQKPLSAIQTQWETHGEIVEGDCEKFLREKIRQGF